MTLTLARFHLIATGMILKQRALQIAEAITFAAMLYCAALLWSLAP